MTIGTDDFIAKFGTRDTTDDGTTSAISDGSLSVAGDITEWTNDDDAIFHTFDLTFQYTGTLDAHPFIDVHARAKNMDGSTGDEDEPTASYAPRVVATLKIDPSASASTNINIMSDVFALVGNKTSAVWEFWIENKTGGTISASWTAHVTPIAQGPHA